MILFSFRGSSFKNKTDGNRFLSALENETFPAFFQVVYIIKGHTCYVIAPIFQTFENP